MEDNMDKSITEKITSEQESSSSSDELEEKGISKEAKPVEAQSDDKDNLSSKSNTKKISHINPMQEIEIEKMILNCGGIDDKLEKSVKLLGMITGKKVFKTKAKKRIPGFGISPGKEAGCKVTLRYKEQINGLLKRFFVTFSNEISEKKIRDNHLSFGIHEYIEVPGLEYDRDIGILGFEVDVVFKRKGKRVTGRKIKRGKYPKKQQVTKHEIIDFLNDKFGVEVI